MFREGFVAKLGWMAISAPAPLHDYRPEDDVLDWDYSLESVPHRPAGTVSILTQVRVSEPPPVVDSD